MTSAGRLQPRENSRLVATFAVAIWSACALLGAGGASAQSLIEEVKLGILYHDASHMWSGFRIEDTGADVNAEVLFRPTIPFIIGNFRPVIGGTWTTTGGTSHVYADLRWQTELGGGFFLGLGAGGAVHDGHLLPDSWNHKALGSRLLFHFPAELGYRFDSHSSLSIYFEHTSNAWLARYNEGLDRIGVRYGYKF